MTQLPDCYLVQAKSTDALATAHIADVLVAALQKRVSGEITVLTNSRTADVYYITARVT